MKLLFPYFFIFTFLISFSFNAQEYQPTTKNIEAREWFQDARFGLFVHWGVYSVLGDGEWVMNNQNISIEEYEKLPHFLIRLILILKNGFLWPRMLE
jgi:alpha-L-fucosidase